MGATFLADWQPEYRPHIIHGVDTIGTATAAVLNTTKKDSMSFDAAAATAVAAALFTNDDTFIAASTSTSDPILSPPDTLTSLPSPSPSYCQHHKHSYSPISTSVCSTGANGGYIVTPANVYHRGCIIGAAVVVAVVVAITVAAVASNLL